MSTHDMPPGRGERPQGDADGPPSPPYGDPGGGRQHSSSRDQYWARSGPAPGADGAWGFFDSLRRSGIWRGQDRWVGGVAAGVARRLDVDPLLVRGVLVVVTFFGGLGLLLYGLAWALLPEESDGRIHLQEALRGNVDAALAGALALVVVGLARPGTWWGGWWYVGEGITAFMLTVSAIALVVIGAVSLSRRGQDGRGAPGGAPQAAPGVPPQAGGWAQAAPGGTPQPGAWASDRPGQHAATSGAGAPGAATGDPGRSTGTTEHLATGQHGDAPPWAGVGGPAATAGPRAFGTTATYPVGAAPYAAGAAPQQPGPAPYPVGAAPYPPRATTPPPAPPRPATPGPGRTTVAVVLALCLTAVAGVLLWDRTESLGWLLPVTIGGVVLAVLGLGVMLAGARGRRGGALSVLGVLLALLVAPLTVAASVSPADLGFSPGARIGDVSVAPENVAQAEQGYEVVAGDVELDLRGLEAGSGPVTVPVDVGAGDVDVLVPADAAVRVEARVAFGEVESRTRPGWSAIDEQLTPSPGSSASREWVTWASGTGIDTTLSSPAAQEDGADLIVVVRAGASTVYIEEDA